MNLMSLDASCFISPGSGKIWMDNVDCFGYESSLSQCRQLGWGINNCDAYHGEDASVVCDNSTIEDIANNYCREVLPVTCKDNNRCFPLVTCVDLSVLTNTGKKESICLECPDKYIGDGITCRGERRTKILNRLNKVNSRFNIKFRKVAGPIYGIFLQL
jgi:hypothetical protein